MPNYKGVMKDDERFAMIRMDGFIYRSVTNNITALSGGGQSSATPVSTNIVRVTTVAVANDSITLPPAKAGLELWVKNAGANSLNVFPNTGDAINALAANAAYALATVKSAMFFCAVDGTWDTSLSA